VVIGAHSRLLRELLYAFLSGQQLELSSAHLPQSMQHAPGCVGGGAAARCAVRLEWDESNVAECAALASQATRLPPCISLHLPCISLHVPCVSIYLPVSSPGRRPASPLHLPASPYISLDLASQETRLSNTGALRFDLQLHAAAAQAAGLQAAAGQAMAAGAAAGLRLALANCELDAGAKALAAPSPSSPPPSPSP